MRVFYLGILFVLMVLMGGFPLEAAQSFDDVQILERDEARIKATGNLRGGEKLMRVKVRFRDADMMVMGNDFRYEYLTLIPYGAVESAIYSDIGEHLPDNLQQAAPLHRENYGGDDQRWLELVYVVDGKKTDVLLVLDRDTDDVLLDALDEKLKAPVVRYLDGIAHNKTDVAFRDCRYFRTVRDENGKSETDDFVCLVMMRDDAFQIVGQDDDYQAQFDVPYDTVRGLFYEHSKETSFMGRLPGIGAFRKAKHWFVIEGKETTALVLEPEIVADFRDVAQAKTHLSINAYAAAIQRPAQQATVLPEVLSQSLGDGNMVQELMAAKTIRCLLGPGSRANWADGKLKRLTDARYDDEAPNLIFEEIDLDAQTAIAVQGNTRRQVRVVASEKGFTFLAIDQATFVTTVFARDGGQLVCVHSVHVADGTPLAGQFYGVAEVTEKR